MLECHFMQLWWGQFLLYIEKSKPPAQKKRDYWYGPEIGTICGMPQRKKPTKSTTIYINVVNQLETASLVWYQSLIGYTSIKGKANVNQIIIYRITNQT